MDIHQHKIQLINMINYLQKKKLKTELKRTEQVVKRRVSLSNQDVTKQIYSCLLCGEPLLSDSQGVDKNYEQNWKVCHDCQNTVCPNCAVQVGKNSDSEMFWLCKLCQKKRQLIVSSNSWLQNLTKTNNEKTKEMQTIIQNNKHKVSNLNDVNNRQEIDNETWEHLTLNNLKSVEQHEDICCTKENQLEKISEQTNSLSYDNQYANNQYDIKSIKQKSINDSITKKASSVIIDEELFEMNRKYAKSTFPQIVYDDQADISTCTVTSMNIPSYMDKQQIINDDYATSSADYVNTLYQSTNNQQHEHFTENDGDNVVTSNYNESVDDTLQSFYPSKYIDLEFSGDISHLSLNDLLKLEMLNTCNQLYVDRDDTSGSIIPQHSYDVVSENNNKGDTIEANEITMTKLESDYSHMTDYQTRRLSQHLHTYQDDENKLSNDINNMVNSTAANLSTGLTDVTSASSYYSDNSLQSSSEDHKLTFDSSMNDSYLNWLNELNPSYNLMQQDNLHNTSIDYTSECSIMSSMIPQSTTSTYTTNDNETTKQNLLLKRCPNFENISRLSNDQAYANNNNNNIQLTETNSNLFSGLIQFPEGVNDDKDDLEVINDTPTKVWGREFRDTLQNL
ncbi:protein piccolo [Schistosoma japonicum]|nr:protein piccolo [Schistosoma japonicum]